MKGFNVVDKKLINFVLDNDLSLTDVYCNSFLTRLANFEKAYNGDHWYWDEQSKKTVFTNPFKDNYSKFVVQAYKGTLNRFSVNVYGG